MIHPITLLLRQILTFIGEQIYFYRQLFMKLWAVLWFLPVPHLVCLILLTFDVEILFWTIFLYILLLLLFSEKQEPRAWICFMVLGISINMFKSWFCRDPNWADIKLAQVKYLLSRLSQFKELVSNKFTCIPSVLVAGDFNSTPGDEVSLHYLLSLV